MKVKPAVFAFLFFSLMGLNLQADSLTEARQAEIKKEAQAYNKYLLAYKDNKLSKYSKNFAKQKGIALLTAELNDGRIKQKQYEELCKEFDYTQSVKIAVSDDEKLIKEDIRRIMEIASGADPAKYLTLKSIKREYSDKTEELEKLKASLWLQASARTSDSEFQSGLLAILLFFDYKIPTISKSKTLFKKIQAVHFQTAVSLNPEAVKVLFENIIDKSNKANRAHARQMLTFCFNRNTTAGSETSTSLDVNDSDIFAQFVELIKHLNAKNPEGLAIWLSGPLNNDVDQSEDIVFNWLCYHRSRNKAWENGLVSDFSSNYFAKFTKEKFENEKDIGHSNYRYSSKTVQLLRRFFWNRIVEKKKFNSKELEKSMKGYNPHVQIYFLRLFFSSQNFFEKNILNNANTKTVRQVLKRALSRLPVLQLHDIYDFEEIKGKDGNPIYKNRTIYSDYNPLVQKAFSNKTDQKFILDWNLKSEDVYELSNLKVYEAVRELPDYESYEKSSKFSYVINHQGQVSKPEWINRVQQLYGQKKIVVENIEIVFPVPYSKNKEHVKNNSEHTVNVKEMSLSLLNSQFFKGFLENDRELKKDFIAELKNTMNENYLLKEVLLTKTLNFIIHNKLSISDSTDPLYTVLGLMLDSSDEIKKDLFWKFYEYVQAKEKHTLLGKYISSTDDFTNYISLDYLNHIYGNPTYPLELQMNAAHNYGFINNEDKARLFNYILTQMDKYKSKDNIKNFKKCFEHLDILAEFSDDQKIEFILSAKLDKEFRQSAIGFLPGKLLDAQHEKIKTAFGVVKSDKGLLKSLLLWVKNKNKERRYGTLIVDQFFAETVDVEIRGLAKETVDEILRNENAKFEKEEYKKKLKELDDKIKKKKKND